MRLFAATLLISLLSTLFSAWQAWQMHGAMERLASQQVLMTQNIGRILLYDEVLTMSARLAAATGDLAYEARYRQFDPLLKREINALKAGLPQVELAQFVNATVEANQALVKMERQAFALARQGQRQEAQTLLSSKDYTSLRESYTQGMEETSAAVARLIAAEQQHAHALSRLAALASAIGLLLLVASWISARRALRQGVKRQQELKQALRDANDALEGRIEQRTSELCAANEQLRRELLERQQAQETLRLSALKHRLLFESSRDALMIIEPPLWKFTDANEATLKLFGASSSAEFTALGPWSVSPKRQPDGRLSSEKSQEMIAAALREGSRLFEWTHLRLDGRPFLADVLLTRMEVGEEVFLQATVRDLSERRLEEKQRLAASIRLKQALTDAIGAIAATLEQRDPYTAGHQRRVAELAAAIAGEMGRPANEIEGIHFGGLIHDIGKISVPAEILGKPGRISDIEFGLIKAHAEAGYQIVHDIAFPWPVADMVRQHHERLDGSGYPQGLKGEQIMLEARILAVADILEAMSANRPYRPGLGQEAALAEITHQRGIQLDQVAVDACLRLFNEKGFTFTE